MLLVTNNIGLQPFVAKGVVGDGEDLTGDMGFELGLEGCQERTKKGLTVKENSLCKCVELQEYAVLENFQTLLQDKIYKRVKYKR